VAEGALETNADELVVFENAFDPDDRVGPQESDGGLRVLETDGGLPDRRH
jgi:hypothetical protein